MSIKIEHLNYVYSAGTAYEKQALKDICLEIPHGEFVGVIGHTGSGKSTLIQHLNGLIRATSGALYYNGENIYEDGYNMKALRNQVGLVFQYPEHQLFDKRANSHPAAFLLSGFVLFLFTNSTLTPKYPFCNLEEYSECK